MANATGQEPPYSPYEINWNYINFPGVVYWRYLFLGAMATVILLRIGSRAMEHNLGRFKRNWNQFPDSRRRITLKEQKQKDISRAELRKMLTLKTKTEYTTSSKPL